MPLCILQNTMIDILITILFSFKNGLVVFSKLKVLNPSRAKYNNKHCHYLNGRYSFFAVTI